MAECEVCGNDYEHAFTLTQAGESHTFDTFQCAIHAMAPVCAQCGCRIVGQGRQSSGRYYCGAHCANAST